MRTLMYHPCETRRITSPFGWRTHPVTGIRTMHNGIDISPIDKDKYYQEPIWACASGTVIESGYNSARGYQVLIEHGGSGKDKIRTRYQHLASIEPAAKIGKTVTAGQLIGRMGSTGTSTAQHLHFEVIFNGNPVNPESWICGLPIPTEDDMATRYQKVGDLPKSLQPEIQQLINAGSLKGDENGNLNITEDMARTLIIAKRYADGVKK